MTSKIPSPCEDIDLWMVSLDRPQSVQSECRALLSEAECQRADRFLHPEPSRRFVLRRGFLRKILSKYLSVAPGEIVFQSGDYGKPALVPDFSLYFNASHSHEMALVAVSARWEIGVDIEYQRTIETLPTMVRRYLGPAERQWLESVPHQQQNAVFLRFWTAKEALLKGIGLGLTLPVDRVHLEVAPGEPAKILALADHSTEGWQLELFSPEARYTAALAWNKRK